MKRFIIFLGIGGISTLIQFLLLMIFIECELTNEVVASGLSYALAAIFNYLANYYVTFSTNNGHLKTLPKFVVTAALGLSLNVLLFAIFNAVTANYILAQLLATIITTLLNFMMHKLWTYRNPE